MKSSHFRQECSVHPSSRENCGFSGMPLTLCINMSCCYDELNRCFHPKLGKDILQNDIFLMAPVIEKSTTLRILFSNFLAKTICMPPAPRGCLMPNYIYKNIDCDGDGILDHVCFSRMYEDQWLVLSTEGCPSHWGNKNRDLSDCIAAFPGIKGIFTKNSHKLSKIAKSLFSHNLLHGFRQFGLG